MSKENEKYVCMTDCYWGPSLEMFKFWKRGEVFHGVPLNQNGEVNTHFKDMHEDPDVEFQTHAMNEMDGMPKKEINTKYNLGLSNSVLKKINKNKIIEMALKKVG